MMKHAPAAVLCLCMLVPLPAFAEPDLGLALGPWSFASGGPGPGTYAYTGLAIGGGRRLELEASGIVEMTPSPGDTILAGASLGFSVGGPRIPTYFNVVVDLGYLQTVVDDGQFHLGPSYLLLRLSPLVIGNPWYGHRERIFSLGVLYDIPAASFSVVWNVLILHWYPWGPPLESVVDSELKAGMER
jgi:hypothetical protein